MRDEVLKVLAAREERVKLGGRELVVRELASALDCTALLDETDSAFKMLVRCVYDPDGNLVFTDDDIPALKVSSRIRFKPLMDAVVRVNGFDEAQEQKNSVAAPSGG